MSQKNKKIALYKSFIVLLSVLAVIVLLAGIYLFVTYEQDKEDNNDNTVIETTAETMSAEQNETTLAQTTASNETTAEEETTTQDDENDITSAAEENLKGADKAISIVKSSVIETYGENYEDTYYIENVGLNGGLYVYCLRRSEDTYAQKWYYVDADTFELTVE